MLASEMLLGKVISAPFDENTYIAHLTNRRDCIVFDPGFDPDSILEYLEKHELTPAAILCTHGHSDHIAGNAAMKDRWPRVPLVIGVGDASKLTDPQGNLSAAFGASLISPPADRTVDEPDQFEAAGLTLEVLATPGHSSGHVVFLCRQVEPWYVFGGDVLFRGSVGRTDFPGRRLRFAAGVDPRQALHASGRHDRAPGPWPGDDDWPREAVESVRRQSGRIHRLNPDFPSKFAKICDFYWRLLSSAWGGE